MLTIRAMSDGSGYSSQHLEHNDYYAEGERAVGHWQGEGVELQQAQRQIARDYREAVMELRLTPAF